MDLLSVNTVVEAPIIIVKLGEYTFGFASKVKTAGGYTINYPNFLKSVSVVKINGEVNTYTVNMSYQISAGDDPNLIDKVLSSISNTREMTISYGDCSAPGYMYKEEVTLITNVKSDVQITSGNISYTISAVSKSLSLLSKNYSFPALDAKPSDVMYRLLNNSQYGLKDVFPGMQNTQNVIQQNLIASNDTVVHLEAQPQSTVLDYMVYLCNCMRPIQGKSIYRLAIVDDNKNKMGGSYFKVQEISSSTIVNSDGQDVYSIDIGYPGDNFITGFSLRDNEQWSILYNNSLQDSMNNFTYMINNDGVVTKTASNSITRSSSKYISTASEDSWWTGVTEFPISASLTLKGLVRPSMLMSYVVLNVLFYGQKHLSSGTYIITKQTDTIDGRGYRTVLELLRVRGEH